MQKHCRSNKTCTSSAARLSRALFLQALIFVFSFTHSELLNSRFCSSTTFSSMFSFTRSRRQVMFVSVCFSLLQLRSLSQTGKVKFDPAEPPSVSIFSLTSALWSVSSTFQQAIKEECEETCSFMLHMRASEQRNVNLHGLGRENAPPEGRPLPVCRTFSLN